VSTAGLLDTSIFIASETGRELHTSDLPDEMFVSVITSAELQLGVLAAVDIQTRARRLATVNSIAHLELLPVDREAAARWAELRVRLARAGRKMNVNDLWIAAIAAANDLPVVTQDADFEAIESIGGPAVLRVSIIV
jgi:predicted nucleic acid-binding protein